MLLYNRVNKKELKQKLMDEPFKRRTVSFYRYALIENPQQLRDHLYQQWRQLNVFGRIYLANEGINAQMSVPESNWNNFVEQLNANELFKGIPIKFAVEDDGKSFYKLSVKVRPKIVADGLDPNTFDVTNVGTHLTAKEFNEAMEQDGTIVVDMRNFYESEVGHFAGAICPDVDTFREELPLVADQLKENKNNKILLYCTGGIRCEKASAYLKHQGFNDVNQLYGGVIEYARQIKAQGLPSKFIGKNFVFDERMGERITQDIISKCHQCDAPCDTHVNCANDECHLLFIQCSTCATAMNGCCSNSCKETIQLPADEQRKLRKGPMKADSLAVYKSRIRPRLKDMRLDLKHQ